MATASTVERKVKTPLNEPDKYYEVVNGQIVEAPPLDAYEGWIADDLARAINFFDPDRRLGRVATEQLFILDESPRLRRRPDLAFVSIERWPVSRLAPRQSAWGVIPDLAVEIVSQTDKSKNLMAKIEEYFDAGVRLVWVLYPDQRKIYVYESPEVIRVLRPDDDLDGGVVLPGFRLPVSTVFGPVQPEPSPTS